MQSVPHLLTPLPAERSSLVGRDDELAELRRLVRDRRIVTVVGPGGIGKTRIVMALAHELAKRGERVGFVELADVAEAGVVPEALADQLSVEVVSGAARRDGLVRWLATAPTVLIVDNMEQVIDAAPELAAILDECPALHLIATSRRPLRIAGEHLLTLSPLPATSPAGTAEAPGVRLLLDRSRTDHPGPADIEAASRIVAGVGGLPLAIELAAFRAQTLGMAAAHELLIADLALDGLSSPETLPERHRDLRRCLQWTYRDLDDHARAVFCALGAFAGTFDLAALRAVVGEERVAAVGLASLIEHHVVLRDPAANGTARYTTIPPIREFARELLLASPDRHAIVDAHARWYGIVAERIRRTFECESPREAIAAQRREQPNISRAIATRVRQHDYAGAAAVTCAGAKIASEIGRESQVNWWFRELLRRAGAHGATLPAEARVWAAYAELATHAPATAAVALRALEDAIDRAREARDELAVLRGLDRLTISVTAHGDLARSLAASAEGIELAERLGITWSIAQFATWHAMLRHVAGDLPAAHKFGFEALRVARQLADGRLLLRLGLLFAPMERTATMDAEQVPTLERCLELARDEGSVVDEMYVLMQLAVRAGLRNDDGVFALALQGLALADRTRSHPAELVFVFALAGAAFTAGDEVVGKRLDRGLRPEWAALSTVMPSGALDSYEQTLATRRSATSSLPAQRDADPVTWPETIAMARRYAEGRGRPGVPAASPLTARELDVLRLVARGRTNKEIAAALRLQPKTVMHHCSAIFRKLQVTSRTEAAATAVRQGLADLS